MKKEINSLIFISDDEQNCDFVKNSLSKTLDRVILAKSPVEASLKITNEHFKVLLVDFKSVKEQHYSFIYNIAVNNPNLHIAILTKNKEVSEKPEFQNSNIKVFEPPKEAKTLVDMISPYLYGGSAGTQTKRLSTGETLIKKGDQDKNVYFVIEGSFFVLDNIEGQKVVLGTINKGEIVGMMSLLTDSVRSANVIAAEDSVVTEIPKETIRASLAKQPFWVRTLFKTMSLRLIETNKKLAQMALKNKS